MSLSKRLREVGAALSPMAGWKSEAEWRRERPDAFAEESDVRVAVRPRPGDEPGQLTMFETE